MEHRITAQVLNGSTGEVREIVARVGARTEQDAVDKLFSQARKDDYYYRFLGHSGVIIPASSDAIEVKHGPLIYWALEN